MLEFLLVGLIVIMWKMPGYLGRFSGVVLSAYLLPLILQKQVFYTESSGAVQLVTIGYPTILLTAWIPTVTLIMYISVAQVFELMDRDIIGRKKNKGKPKA